MRLPSVVVWACMAYVAGHAAAQANCFPVLREQILGSDLAAANAVFAAVPPDQTIAFAPVPGTQRILAARDLLGVAKKFDIQGFEPSTLTNICFERTVEAVDPARMRTAMAVVLAIPEEQIQITDFSHFRTPAGQMEFLRSGLAPAPVNTPEAPAFWRGRVIYDHGRSMAIWAKIKVLVESSMVTAIASISSGQLIEPDQVSIVLTKQFPVPSDVLKNVDQAVGKRARRSIPAGSPIRANLLEAPREIGQGDVVQVNVVDGQAQITFQAKAQSGGRKGDTILIQNPSNGRSFKATIIDKAKVEVRPSGA